jgi:hypothetical protein
MAPPPSAGRYLRSLTRPWSALSSSLFTALFSITARTHDRYPCCAPEIDKDTDAMLARAFDKTPGARANDGVAPIRSQLWGKLAWTGHADHLDVLGHFDDASDNHVDWLTSGSGFDRRRFEAMLDAIFEGMQHGRK